MCVSRGISGNGLDKIRVRCIRARTSEVNAHRIDVKWRFSKYFMHPTCSWRGSEDGWGQAGRGRSAATSAAMAELGGPSEVNGARRSWRRFLPVALILMGTAGFFAFGLQDYVSCAFLKDHHEALSDIIDRHEVLSALVFMVIYTVSIAFSLPIAVILTFSGGFLFGLWHGTAYVVTAATVGATGLFLATRSAFGQGLRGRAGPAVARMEQGFRNHAMSYLLFLRLTPVFPFWLVNLVSAVVGLPLRTFVFATAVGIVPASFIYVSVGNGLNALLEFDETCDPRAMVSAEVLLPLLGLAALSLLPIIYKKLRGESPPIDKSHGQDHG